MGASNSAGLANWKRVCIFVDGENFRFSLTDLFSKERYQFKKQDYLPEANWHNFFLSLIDIPGWELVRVYWYVTNEIDFWPHVIPYRWEEKRRFFENKGVLRSLKEQGEDISSTEIGLKKAEDILERRKKSIQKRATGWRSIQAAIEREHNQIQFQRIGSISYNSVIRSFGTEKGVDTQLTADMITLSNIYDVALIVSGDADYIPPVSAIKNLGKLVYSVSFLTENGNKLPGGAWRLERCVDGQIELPFEVIKKRLGIKEKE